MIGGFSISKNLIEAELEVIPSGAALQTEGGISHPRNQSEGDPSGG